MGSWFGRVMGLIGLVLVLGLAGMSTARAADPTLVGWWALDDGSGTIAKDSSGNQNHGTLKGPQWVAGKLGGALRFVAATAEYVEVPDSPSLDVTDTITIAAWVLREVDSGGWDRLVAKSDASVYDYWLQISNSDTIGGGIRDAANVVHNFDTVAGPAIPLNQWTHLAFVYDGVNLLGYINGQVVKSVNIGPFKLMVSTRPLWFRRLANTYNFRGLMDDICIYSRALTQAEVQRIMNGVGSQASASEPRPANQATDVPRDVTLSWNAGPYPSTHDVYLGTTFADVNSAARTTAQGLLASRGQADTTFDAPGSLAYGQTYYWRIDEVNTTADGTIHKGRIWSFTVEPYAYPITKITATASSSQPDMGPEKTVDGSGLAGDLHGTDGATMWLSTGAGPNWIQYEFDQAYRLYELKVWNSNQNMEPFLGFGAKDVQIEYSLDGAMWTALAGVPQFARAPGTPDSAANTTVRFGGVEAKFVKLTVTAAWGTTPPVGLAEVRFLYIPLQARLPQPANAATGVSVGTDLNWRPGRAAASHQVYFSADPNAVTNGTVAARTVTDHRFAPGVLNLDTTYYWRVDEVNAVTYQGSAWSFTTQPYLVVEDFESYTAQEGNRVYEIWLDGSLDKSSGSIVGLFPDAINGTFCETTIFHGGKQSMPLAYDNTAQPFSSEATRTFDPPQDWTASGIKSLSLWFLGADGNTGQLYVKINGTKISYNGEAAALARVPWQVWNIDLSQAGKLNSIRTLVIGIEGTGVKGTLYLDDLRLYPKAPEYLTPVQPAATGLVASYQLDEGAGTAVHDSSGNKNDGTLRGSPQWATGRTGGALRFGGTADYVEVPDSPSLQVTDTITVAAWIFREVSKSGYERILAKSDASLYDYWLQVTNSGSVGCGFMDAAGVARNLDGVRGTVLPVNQWVHVAFVYDGTYVRAYVNGQLDKSANIGAFKIRTGARPLWLGRLQNYYVLQGSIDEACIYNRALTPEEILGLTGQKTATAKPF